MNRFAVSLLAAVVFAAPAFSQVAPPAVPDNGVEPEKTEFKTPESTVNMLRLAIVKADAAGFKECYDVKNKLAAQFVDAFGEMTIALRSMTKLAAEKFKNDAEVEKYATTAAQFADAMECTKIEIDGDTAKGSCAKDPSKTIYFKKVDGKWRFDTIKTIPISAETLGMAKAMPAKTKVFNQAREELAAGKFKNFGEMRDRLAELFAAEKKADK